MSAPTRVLDRTLTKVVVVIAALAVATLVEVVTDASVPGRMPLFALGATFVLVLGAKRLGAVIQRPLTTAELVAESGEGGEVHDG